VLGFLSGGTDAAASFCFDDPANVLAPVRHMEQALSDRNAPFAALRALLQLVELFIILSESTPVSSGMNTSPAPVFISEIKQYIDEAFPQIHSVNDLADRFFYSREYITRIFRQYYNTPLYEYILRRKLLYSCTLLRQGFTVESAASQAGFRNMSSFIKVFRKFHGCTPSEYKNRHFTVQ